MKALSLTVQKLWPMQKFFADERIERQTDRQNYMLRSIDGGGVHEKEKMLAPFPTIFSETFIFKHLVVS